MLKIRYHTKFKRDYKMIKKRGYDISKLESIILQLANQQVLPAKNKDHTLQGNFNGFRECHIEPDWLLVYCYTQEDELTLVLTRTGTHSDLF